MKRLDKIHPLEPTVKIEPPIFYFKNIDLIHEVTEPQNAPPQKKHFLRCQEINEEQPPPKKIKTQVETKKTQKLELNSPQNVSINISKENEFYAKEDIKEGITFVLGELSKMKKNVILKYGKKN